MRDYPGPLVYEPDRERLMRAFHSAVEGSTGSEQFRIKTKDGQVLWAEMSWLPIYDEKGNPLGHRESIRDVTARKLAERAAELAEQEKEAILDNMEEHIIHLDSDTSILWANRAACDAIGLAREEIIGRLCEEVHADWHEPWGPGRRSRPWRRAAASRWSGLIRRPGVVHSGRPRPRPPRRHHRRSGDRPGRHPVQTQPRRPARSFDRSTMRWRRRAEPDDPAAARTESGWTIAGVPAPAYTAGVCSRRSCPSTRVRSRFGWLSAVWPPTCGLRRLPCWIAGR